MLGASDFFCALCKRATKQLQKYFRSWQRDHGKCLQQIVICLCDRDKKKIGKPSIISMEWLLCFGEIIFLSLNVLLIAIKDTSQACHETDRKFVSKLGRTRHVLYDIIYSGAKRDRPQQTSIYLMTFVSDRSL